MRRNYTLEEAARGVGSAFSKENPEKEQRVEETGRAWESLGKAYIGPTEAEKSSIAFRRSLYIVKDLKAGDVLTQDNVRAIRPGLGLPPKHLNYVLGMVLMRNVNYGTALSLEMLSNLKIPKKR